MNLRHNIYLALLILFGIYLSSCTRTSREVFRYIPENAKGVLTFHPKNLFEKGRIKEINFLKEEFSEYALVGKILENPEAFGVQMDNYAAAFISEDPVDFDCFALPLDSRTQFEESITNQLVESGTLEESGKINEGFNSIITEKHLILSGRFVALIFTDREGNNIPQLESIANDLVSMEKEYSIMGDKDFKEFLRRQKDLNAWFNSSNLKGLTAMGFLNNGMNEMSGLNNNYGHVFLDFQKGNISLSTNLRFNYSLQSTIEKYNFLDETAIKDLLQYLPEKDLVFVMNNNLDPEKIFDLLKFVNRNFKQSMDRTIDKLGMDPEEAKNAVNGEFALSFHGVKDFHFPEDTESLDPAKIPFIVSAFRVKDLSFFEEFLSVAGDNPELVQKDGYYAINHESIPVYMILKNKDMILSNDESVIREISRQGMVSQNLTRSNLEPLLTKNPVCFYLNMDKDTYSRETGEYLQNEMGRSLTRGVETFGDQLKSLTFSARLEEWELRLDLKNLEEYSLYTLLHQVDISRSSD